MAIIIIIINNTAQITNYIETKYNLQHGDENKIWNEISSLSRKYGLHRLYTFYDMFYSRLYKRRCLEKCTLLCAECANAYGDDQLCTYWAITGECEENADFMTKYCHKACSRCDADSIGIQPYSFCYFYTSVLSVVLRYTIRASPSPLTFRQTRLFHSTPDWLTDECLWTELSGVTMGWLLRLVTGGPTGGTGPPTVVVFLVINFRGPDLRKWRGPRMVALRVWPNWRWIVPL